MKRPENALATPRLGDAHLPGNKRPGDVSGSCVLSRQSLRFVAVDDFGAPVERDIPLYNLAGVLAEHRRHLTNRKVAA